MTAAEQNHLSLSAYLGQVARALRAAMPDSSWVVAELSDFKRRPNGHVYMDILESEGGKEVAKARVTMFANVATKVLAEWHRVTCGDPQPGMRVLVKVRAEFSPQYGFSLNATGIDPNYTLGDMQARLQEIISSLKARGWFDLQRQLPGPGGFWRVAVISPHEAAGLADFRRDAEVLDQAGVCAFEYFSAVFQGKDASEGIRGALRSVHERHQQAPFDVVCIIRGGGAKADLAWLNDATLAAWVCRLPIPVFTGIGHEVDECVLDLVAHRKFDTPSKVVGFIKTSLLAEAASARTAMTKASNLMLSLARGQHPALERSWSAFTRQVRGLIHGQQQRVLRAGGQYEQTSGRLIATHRMALQRSSGDFSRLAPSLCTTHRHKTQQAASRAASLMQSLLVREKGRLDLACALYDRTNPLALLQRGFALVRTPSGEIINSVEKARAAGTLDLAFADGHVTVTTE